ncbi:hypothetical protein OH77DRAFT_1422611 [Trametes cingulata]|nr:hypothetical protein OH77DRAFT_1422611 [Trametes cingulata]
MSQVPWDRLKAETVRAVIKDLGLDKYARPGVRRTELVNWLREVETDGIEAVVQRLQERAESFASYADAREKSPELEYAGPAREPAQLHPVVEVPSRPGHSRVHARPRESGSSVGTSAASAARGAGGPPPAKKPRIPPPSYAILHQLEEDIAPPSAAPIPLLRPDLAFEGVFLPPPPAHSRAVRPAAPVDEGPSQSISHGPRPVSGTSPTASRRLEAVVVTRPVEAVKLQWKQSSSAGRRQQE